MVIFMLLLLAVLLLFVNIGLHFRGLCYWFFIEHLMIILCQAYSRGQGHKDEWIVKPVNSVNIRIEKGKGSFCGKQLSCFSRTECI